MSILRRISEGFIVLGKKIISMNSEFLSEEEVVRVTNSQFVKVRREDLSGNFDLILTISTAEADDAKAKELAFMLQTMGNTMGQEVSQMIPLSSQTFMRTENISAFIYSSIKNRIAKPTEYLIDLYLFAIERKSLSTLYRLLPIFTSPLYNL